ncbi:MAG: glycosyltransferase [Gracilibacteraceae bacterium]|jgi:glycosyltransferase EpsD|nr:glycosyltransferase [Gracilibacteraceae bacterium]
MKGGGAKVLYAASTFHHLAQFHLPYLAFLRERGLEVHAAAGGAAADLPAGAADAVWPLPLHKSMIAAANWRCARLLYRLLRRERYALVSVHTSLAAFFLRLAAMGPQAAPLKVMNTVHGYLFAAEARSAPGRPAARDLLLRAAERVTARRTDWLLLMNRDDYAYAAARRLGRETRLIPGMGVDLARFPATSAAERERERAALGLGPADLALVYAAEFSARKNQRQAVRALALLRRERPALAWRLYLPGAGAEAAACRAEAQAAGLGERVIFPGQVQDVRPYYRAADMVISTSLSEGLPFHLTEAMATGLPALAADARGHRELVIPGVTGELFPPADAAALAALIAELGQDPSRRAELGGRARERAALFGLEAAFPVITGIYREILGKILDE